MGSESNHEEKKPGTTEWDHRRKGTPSFRSFKSSIPGLDDKIYKSGAVKHAAQFTKTSEEIADYVQTNFNSDVAEAIRNVKSPTFKMPTRPEKR